MISPTQSVKLTPDQEVALEKLHEWFDNGDQPALLLSAYAGCGKTFLVKHFVNELYAKYGSATKIARHALEVIYPGSYAAVAFTAPTHKAVSVLRKMGGLSTTDGVEFKTIHSLLKLKKVTDFKTGRETFKPDSYDRSASMDYGLVIVDEASMVNNDLRFYIETLYVKGTKVLYVGDEAQLPPVNELESPIFSLVKNKVTLTTIVRQASGSPIIQLAHKVRSDSPRQRISALIDEFGIDYIERNSALLDGFLDDNGYTDNPDQIKVLAWRNKTVASFNKQIRERRYGELAASYQYLPGDILVMSEPWQYKKEGDDNWTLIQNNDEFIIKAVTEPYEITCEELPQDEDPVTGFESNPAKFMARSLLVCYSDNPDVERTLVVPADEDVAEEIEAALDWLKKTAVAHTNNTRLKPSGATMWQRYYQLQGRFAKVLHGYAITVHKAQGSTYQTALIVDEDLAYNNKPEERKSLQYTAITRAAKDVYLIERES